MKKVVIVLISLVCSIPMFAQHFALKNNLLYDATLTPNLSMEFGLGKRATLDIGVGYNPFEFKNERHLKHWLAQPELRFWTCERFNGTFFGIHAHGGEYNVSNLKLPWDMYPNLQDNRYEGYFYGGGISIGHQWVLGKHWNFEASIGGGYARIHYDKYPCGECGPKTESGIHNYWGVTRATLSIVYIFR